MKKVISAILIVITVAFCSFPALASDQEALNPTVMSPQFTGITILAVNLTIDALGCAAAVGQVIPSDNSYTSNLTVSLQQYTSGGWTTIKNWSGSNKGISGVTLNNPYYVAHGTYRTYVTASVYNSTGGLVDYATDFSVSKTY